MSGEDGWGSGWDNEVVAQVIIVGGVPLLVYNPAQVAGDLLASISATNTTDTFGNPVLLGIATYAPGDTTQAIQLFDGELRIVASLAGGVPGTTAGNLFFQPDGAHAPAGWVQLSANPSHSYGLLIGGQGSSPNSFMIVSPSGDATGATDTANIVRAFAITNTVVLTGGQFYLTPGSIALTAQQYLRGQGRKATIIHAVAGAGAGDYLRIQNTGGSGTGLWGGGFEGFYLDGTSADAGSNGIRMGDGDQYLLNEVFVEHFNGGGSTGILLDNQIWWTEKLHGEVWVRDCTANVVFNVGGASTSTNSFQALDLVVNLYALDSQDGVVLQNGPYIYHGRLSVRGNKQASASVGDTSAILRLTGTVPVGHPGAGNGSAIARSQLDVEVEVTSGTSQPYGIVFNSPPTNFIQGCYGILDFTQGAGAVTEGVNFAQSNAGMLSYTGYIIGDQALNPGGNFPQPVALGALQYGQSFMSGSTGNVFSQFGDFFKVTLSASITIDLTPTEQTIPAPQRKIFIITQASAGGPFTVTWPFTIAPTNLNPAVIWNGGSTPTMSAGAGDIDVYELITYNGIVWYGSVIGQNMS